MDGRIERQKMDKLFFIWEVWWGREQNKTCCLCLSVKIWKNQREKAITVYVSLSFAVSRSLSVVNVRFLFVICLPEGN